MKNTGTDKFRHGFVNVYEKYFNELKDNELTLVEFGIKLGKSIEMWKDYFKNADIYGIDIIKESVDIFKNDDRVTSILGDQAKKEDLDRVKDISGQIDILIEDGGHTMEQQQHTLKWMYESIKPGGYFVIEDLHTSLNLPSYVPRHRSKDCKVTTLQLVESISKGVAVETEWISKEIVQDIIDKVEFARVYKSNGNSSILGVLKFK